VNGVLLRLSVIFAAVGLGLRPQGLTRRREGVVGLSFGEDVAGEMRRGGFRTGGSSGSPDRRRRLSFAASRLCGLSVSMVWDVEE
jgi:hypothetical protein